MPDRLGIIDQNVKQSPDPVAYLEDRIRTTQKDLDTIRQQKSQAKPEHKGWYEKQEKFIAEQVKLLMAKREDVRFGTHNFEILRASSKLDEVHKQLKNANLLSAVGLRAKARRAKNIITQYRAQDKDIRRANSIIAGMHGTTYEELQKLGR